MPGKTLWSARKLAQVKLFHHGWHATRRATTVRTLKVPLQALARCTISQKGSSIRNKTAAGLYQNLFQIHPSDMTEHAHKLVELGLKVEMTEEAPLLITNDEAKSMASEKITTALGEYNESKLNIKADPEGRTPLGEPKLFGPVPPAGTASTSSGLTHERPLLVPQLVDAQRGRGCEGERQQGRARWVHTAIPMPSRSTLRSRPDPTEIHAPSQSTTRSTP